MLYGLFLSVVCLALTITVFELVGLGLVRRKKD